MALKTVDLPEPDSPTKPKLSPCLTSNETFEKDIEDKMKSEHLIA